MSVSSYYFEEERRQSFRMWPCSAPKLEDGGKSHDMLTTQLFSLVQLYDDQEANKNVLMSEILNSDDERIMKHVEDLEYNSQVLDDPHPKFFSTPTCVTCPLSLEKLRRSDASEDKVFLELSRGIWKNPESYSKSSFILATPKEVEASFDYLQRESPFVPLSNFSVEPQEGLEFDPMCHSYNMESDSNRLDLNADINSSISFIPIQACDDGTVDDALTIFESSLPKLNLKPKRSFRDISDWTYN
jgi:hypothetical protein